jgi:hypothetical protein
MADETFETLWKHVLEHWDDDAAHQVFLQYCQQTAQLGEAAGRYAVIKRDTVRGAAAQAHIEAAAVLAAASLNAIREARRPLVPRWFVVLTVLAFWSMAAYALMRAMSL